MTYGYARVSTRRQASDGNGLEAQRQQLKAAGADIIYEDAFTGTKAERPQLTKLIENISPGDLIIVTKIDRLGRSLQQVLGLIDDIQARGAKINILNLGVFDDSATGRLMRNVMLCIAEFERDLIIDRTREGREIARQNPDYRDGRPRKFSRDQMDLAMDLLTKHTYKEVAKMTGISKASLAREHARRKGEEIPE